MKKFASSLATLAVAAILVASLQSVASARGEYKKAFDKKYKEALKKTDCNICHIKGEKKNKRNDFGMALSKAGLTEEQYKAEIKDKGLKGKDKDKKGAELFNKALEKVLKDEKNKKIKDALEAGERPAG